MAEDSDVRVWATAISTHSENGRKIIFRYAKELRPTFNRRTKPVRIILVWNYESDSGQPIAEDHRQMNLMEDALETALRSDSFATLAMVSTGENLREWTYYAGSEDGFMTRLNDAFAGMEAFPIELYIADDPEWTTWDLFQAGIA